MGDGDVRFWCQKTERPGGVGRGPAAGRTGRQGVVLAGRRARSRGSIRTSRGSAPHSSGSRPSAATARGPTGSWCAARVHTETRARLEAEGPFDVDLYRGRLQEIAAALRGVRGPLVTIMCGIAGIHAWGARQFHPALVEAMTECLAHRGPDDAGYAAFAGAGARPASWRPGRAGADRRARARHSATGG